MENNAGDSVLNKNNQNKQISVFDSGKAEEKAWVVRYIGTENIEAMFRNKQYIEAFLHTQLGVEKILWDKIIGMFKGKEAIAVRNTIEGSRDRKDKSRTHTAELIKWTHFLRVINDDEYSDLMDFNRKRNDIMHSHGSWWDGESYKEALKKGTRFMNENGMK